MINELEMNTNFDWSVPKSAHWPTKQQQSVGLSKPLEGSWPPAWRCWTPTKLPETATQHHLRSFYTVNFTQSGGAKESTIRVTLCQFHAISLSVCSFQLTEQNMIDIMY